MTRTGLGVHVLNTDYFTAVKIIKRFGTQCSGQAFNAKKHVIEAAVRDNFTRYNKMNPDLKTKLQIFLKQWEFSKKAFWGDLLERAKLNENFSESLAKFFKNIMKN